MKRVLLIIALLASAALQSAGQDICCKVEKIWGDGQHCAFTSLIEYEGRIYCTFREGASHIFDKDGNAEGKIRILVSKNGRKWKSLALIGKEGYDLRDPKLSVTPDGRLMVSLGGSIYRNRKFVGGQSHVMFSEDGKTFTEPIPVVIDKEVDSKRDWIWRVTWHGDTGYGVNYDGGERISLLSTKDGIHYNLVKQFDMEGFPNETTIRFLSDGTMTMMVRREKGDKKALWGTSKAPYTEWEWTPMPMFVGGPDHIILDDSKVVAGGRSLFIPKAPKTVLYTGKIADGTFQETIVLPSGGDTSYPGFIIKGDELWVSYYSTHETSNASIYLAKIPLKMFGK